MDSFWGYGKGSEEEKPTEAKLISGEENKHISRV